MYEMLRNNAANIHETDDWDVVFAVIEIVGAGASPDDQVFIYFYAILNSAKPKELLS